MNHWRAAALFLALVILSSCGQYLGAMDLRDLQADAAGELRMPGADQIGRLAKDRTLTPDGPSMAFYGHVFGTKASKDDVTAFYAAELAKLGWSRNNGAVNRSSTDLRVEGWCKPRVTFRLAIKNPDPKVNNPRLDSTGQLYPTVFDAELVAVDPAENCVAR